MKPKPVIALATPVAPPLGPSVPKPGWPADVLAAPKALLNNDVKAGLNSGGTSMVVVVCPPPLPIVYLLANNTAFDFETNAFKILSKLHSRLRLYYSAIMQLSKFY